MGKCGHFPPVHCEIPLFHVGVRNSARRGSADSESTLRASDQIDAASQHEAALEIENAKARAALAQRQRKIDEEEKRWGRRLVTTLRQLLTFPEFSGASWQNRSRDTQRWSVTCLVRARSKWCV